MKKKAAYMIPVLLGVLFCFYYIYLASDNMAYTDYIRLINSYLPDVWNPDKFFVPDILTRVPITYLARGVNVELFGYNTYFDMALGIVSLGLGAVVLAVYAWREKYVSWIWFMLCLFVYYGLNKWEMMTNGTGWVCFLSLSGFYWHYEVLDRAVRTGHKRRERVILMLLPSALTLFVAGPYCGSYSAILLLVYLVMIGDSYRKEKKINRLYLGYLAAAAIPLGLYLWSNSYAVYVHRGAVEGSIAAEFFRDPLFFVTFLLKAFASAVVGWNQFQEMAGRGSFFGSDVFIYMVGTFVIVLYLYALYLNWKCRVYEKTVFPLLLILNGGLNHLLILSARWIFLKNEYGMSSRYALQYQMGILGIMLTFAVVWNMRREQKTETVKRPKMAAAVICLGILLILGGNVWTTREEMKTAPFRKDYLKISRDLGLNYRTATDEELVTYLHNDADAVRNAMRILEENNLNLFRK